MRLKDSVLKSISLQDTAAYQVGDTQAIVSCIFKENSEPITAIIERLIKSEVSK
jgi:hypothetical protein